MHYLPNLYLIKIFRRTFSLTCNSYGLTLPNPWPTCIPATHCAGSAITNYLFKIRMYLCFYVKMYCPLLFSNVSFCPKVIDIGRKGNVVDRSLSSYMKRQPGMLTASISQPYRTEFLLRPSVRHVFYPSKFGAFYVYFQPVSPARTA